MKKIVLSSIVAAGLAVSFSGCGMASLTYDFDLKEYQKSLNNISSNLSDDEKQTILNNAIEHKTLYDMGNSRGSEAIYFPVFSEKDGCLYNNVNYTSVRLKSCFKITNNTIIRIDDYKNPIKLDRVGNNGEERVNNLKLQADMLSKYEKYLNDLQNNLPNLFSKELDKYKNINNSNKSDSLAIVKKDGLKIQYIENPTEEVQLAAIKQNVNSLKYIKQPTRIVQLTAVQEVGLAIEYINNPSEEVQLAAVKNSPNVVEHIRNATEKVQLTAIYNAYKTNANEWLINYIKNPSKKLSILVDSQYNAYVYEYLIEPSNQNEFKMVKEYPLSIKYLNNPSEEIQLIAVQEKGYTIEYIQNPSLKVQLTAVKNTPSAIKYIKNPSLKILITANGGVFETQLTTPNFETSDKFISIKVVGNDVKITNNSQKFIKIKSMAQYFGENVKSIEAFNIPPETVITKSIYEPRKNKITSEDQTIQYGFAIEYKLPNDDKTYDFYKTQKYKVKDLIK